MVPPQNRIGAKKKSLELSALRIAPWFASPSGGQSDISTHRFTEMASGRSSDLRIVLLSEPSRLGPPRQWSYRISSPFTAAGPFPILTGFPFKLHGA